MAVRGTSKRARPPLALATLVFCSGPARTAAPGTKARAGSRSLLDIWNCCGGRARMAALVDCGRGWYFLLRRQRCFRPVVMLSSRLFVMCHCIHAQVVGLKCLWHLAQGKYQCPWKEDTCHSAAAGGHFVVLQWAHANGFAWNENACQAGAGAGTGTGQLGILQLAERSRRQIFAPSGLLFTI
jgi:hypothetical protein